MERSSSLDQLASTPFYCDLLAEAYPFSATAPLSELSLLDQALNSIVAREHEKGLLNIDVADIDSMLQDFLQSCAAEDLSERFRGIPVNQVREFAETALPELANDDDVERFVTQMSQMAVFMRGNSGRLQFAQEPIEHHLISVYLLEKLNSDLQNAFMDLGRCELPPNLVRLLSLSIEAVGIREQLWPRLLERLSAHSVTGRNALHIAVALSSGSTLLADAQFQGMDLSRIRFDSHDLQGASLDSADLTNTDFSTCELAGASLDGCLIKGTKFPDVAKMEGLMFGDMHRFYSAHVGGRFFDEARALQEYVQPTDGQEDSIRPACNAALQLRFLFNKFVRPNGTARRSSLDRRGALRGKEIFSPEQVLNATLQFGYLMEGSGRNRISRADRELYTELREFAMNLTLTSGLRSLLDEVCDDSGDCKHVQSAEVHAD